MEAAVFVSRNKAASHDGVNVERMSVRSGLTLNVSQKERVMSLVA